MDDIPLDTQYTEPPNSPAPSVDFKVKVQNYPSRYLIQLTSSSATFFASWIYIFGLSDPDSHV